MQALMYRRLSKRVKNMQRMGDLACERKAALKKRATKAEEVFMALLRKYNIPFRFQRIVYTENRFFILDFVSYAKPRTIFEIDGSVHDGREQEDRMRECLVLQTRVFSKFCFVRFTNEQVLNGDAEKALQERYPKIYRKWAKANKAQPMKFSFPECAKNRPEKLSPEGLAPTPS